jgi:hypothetical protein
VRIRLFDGICVAAASSEANCGVDVIAENGFRRRDIAAQHTFDAFAEKRFWVLGITRDAGADGLFEITSQGHDRLLLSPFVVQPEIKSCFNIMPV